MKGKRPQDQYVTVGDIHTRFWVQGTQGTALILIHGLGAAVECWENSTGALAQNHRVTAVDLVGFGRWDKPQADYT